MTDKQQQPIEQDENKLIAERRAKLASKREKGNAFPNGFRREHYCSELQEQYGEKSKPELEALAIPVKVAGRVMRNRGAFSSTLIAKVCRRRCWKTSKHGIWVTSSVCPALCKNPERATSMCTSSNVSIW